jgi:hypothetical protein
MKKARHGTERQGEAFDCLAYKRRVQAEVYEETKDMSWEERVAYLRSAVSSGPFRKWWRRLQKQPQVPPGLSRR